MITNTLIVDDDKLSIYLTKTTLERNFEFGNFESANNSYQAIEYLEYCIEKNKNTFPDLILLDLDMPNGNGWHFLEAFGKITPKLNKKVVIYMLSSIFDSESVNRAKRNELVSDFIPKPLVKQDIEKIKRKLASKQEKVLVK